MPSWQYEKVLLCFCVKRKGLYRTAQKTIFSFSKCFEKMVFPKISHWNMIFLVLSGKTIFLFPKNMILFFRHKRKDDLSQKIPGNIMFSSNVWKRRSFQKNRTWTWSFFVISGKMVFIKKHMGKWYFLYIWVDVTGVTLPSWQKSKDTLPPVKYTQGWHLRHHRKKWYSS